MAQYLGPRITANQEPTPPSGNETYFSALKQYGISLGALLSPPSNGWITKLGGWFTRNGGYPNGVKVQMALYEKLAGDLPGQLIAHTGIVTVAAFPGTNLEMALTYINPDFRLGGKTTSPMAVRVTQGQQFIVTVSVHAGGTDNVSTVAGIGVNGGRATADRLYPYGNKAITAGANPSNPFGSYTSAAGAKLWKLALFAVFEDSTQPTATTVSPADGASLGVQTPTFTGTFADTNQATFGDFFDRYEIEVRNGNTGVLLWGPSTGAQWVCTPAEIASNTFSQLYTGPTLPVGAALQWRARVRDFSGEWSIFTDWSDFQIQAFGVVSVLSTKVPSGFVDGDSSLIDWSARWWHNTNLAADRVQVRVLDENNAIVKTGAEVVQAVAAAAAEPGTVFTIQDTVAGIGALAYGRNWKWQMRARDTAARWSGWSEAVAFRTNAIPTLPALIEPATGTQHTTLPTLRAASRDADIIEDIPLTGVVWDFEITRVSNGNVQVISTGQSYDPVNGIVSLPLNSTIIPATGQYSWRVRARDISAGSIGTTAYSGARTFTISDGPVVTIIEPTDNEVQATVSTRVEWSSDDPQTSYLVQLYSVINGVVSVQPIHSSGQVVSTAQFYQIPLGFIENNKSYAVLVTLTNALAQVGSSQLRRFSVSFQGAQALESVDGSVMARLNDVEPTTPRITWSHSQYPTSTFRAYLVKRWATAAGEASAVTLAEISNINQHSFFDYHAPPNVPLTYGVAQRVLAGGQTLDGPTVNVQLSFDLTVPLIASTTDPANVRFPCMWLSRDYGGDVAPRRAPHVTWEAEGKPTIVGSTGGPEKRTIAFNVRTDQHGTMMTKFLRIKNAVKAGHQVSLRDESEQLFMSMARMRWQRGNPGVRRVTIDLEETSYKERA